MTSTGRDLNDVFRVHVSARREAIGTLAVTVAVLVGAAALLWLPTTVGPARAVLPWYALAPAFLVAHIWPVRLRLGRQSIAVGAGDAIVVASVWLARPDELVIAALLASWVHLRFVERQRAVPLLLNLATAGLRLVLTVAVLDLLADVGAPPTLRSGLIAIAAAALGAVAATLVIILAAVLDQGEDAFLGAPASLAASFVLSSASAAVGVLIADGVVRGSALWWLTALPLVLVLAAALGYARERRRSTGLEHALNMTEVVHDARDASHALQRVAEHVRVRFDADRAGIVRVPGDGGTPASVKTGMPDETTDRLFELSAPPTGEAWVIDPRVGSRRTRTGPVIASTVPLPDGGTVTIRLARSQDGASPFRKTDADLLHALAVAAVASLENSRLNDMLARLEELDDMKTAFLTAVSHDLRTPLAVVLGGVSTLSTYGERMDGEQRSALLSRLEAQGRRLDRMLSDLLDIDRLQRGVIEPNRQHVDLSDLAQGIVDGISQTTHPVRVSAEPVVVAVDTGHVSRIVENLVRNAVKYTPDGTPIWVDIRRDATGAQVVVSDAGPGVPAEQREAIFNPFVRGDDAHPSPGTGVGLDLVRRLAELHGGRAWVDERPGGGARFWVTLADATTPAQIPS